MDRDKLESSLQKKGFEMDESKHHRYFHLIVDGKKTNIHTKTSHGSKKHKTLGPPNQSLVKRQLKFEKKKQLEQFIDCTITYEDYIQILTAQGINLR